MTTKAACLVTLQIVILYTADWIKREVTIYIIGEAAELPRGFITQGRHPNRVHTIERAESTNEERGPWAH